MTWRRDEPYSGFLFHCYSRAGYGSYGGPGYYGGWGHGGYGHYPGHGYYGGHGHPW